MVHPSSHKSTNKINGDVFIFGKMWIRLACYLRTYIWSVAMCEESIVLPSDSLAVISFDIFTGDIILLPWLATTVSYGAVPRARGAGLERLKDHRCMSVRTRHAVPTSMT